MEAPVLLLCKTVFSIRIFLSTDTFLLIILLFTEFLKLY